MEGEEDLDVFLLPPPSRLMIAIDLVVTIVFLLLNIRNVSQSWDDVCVSPTVLSLSIISIVIAVLLIFLCLFQWFGYRPTRPGFAAVRAIRLFMTLTLFILFLSEIYLSSPTVDLVQF